jgi:hypothetical protein
LVEVKIKSPLKIGFRLLAILAAGYLLLIGFLSFGPTLKSYLQETNFDSARWKNHLHLDDHDTIKQKMLRDLLSQHKLIGMTVEHINQLLGLPSKTPYFKDYDYVYWLGPEKGLGVDSQWLCIKFQEGVVAKADVLTD